LAKLRLDVRAGRTAEAMTGLKQFARIETSPRLTQIAAPDLARASDAAAVLRAEQRDGEARELLKAAYERALALEQLQTASFVGLSRTALETGDAERGLQLLRLLLALSRTETRETAAAELAALDWVKARAVNAKEVEAPAAANQIAEGEALRLAAETAAEFGRFAEAGDWRERLAALAPDHHPNKIELARTRAAQGRGDDAIATLTALMADARARRTARWTALWTLSEVAAKNDALWRSAESRLHAASQDEEMRWALDSLARGLSSPRPLSARATLLAALLQKNAGRSAESLATLRDSLIPLGETSLAQAISAVDEEPRWLLVRLYAGQQQPRAALKLAGADERLKGRALDPLEELDETPASEPKRARRLAPLAVLATERQAHAREELLALLSTAAEQIADWRQAIEFERARFDLLADAGARRDSKARLGTLLARQKESARKTRRIEFSL
jgi:hypothetical protein